MRSYDVAYVLADGLHLILVPVHPRFGLRKASEMRRFTATVRRHAAAAGLTGEVVPVWHDGSGGLLAFAWPAVLTRLVGLTWNGVSRHINVRLHLVPRTVEPRPEQRNESPEPQVLAS